MQHQEITPETLTALRTLLFFTRLEAAQLIAASPNRPNGVSYRAWKQWEDGERPIPVDVAENIMRLADRRTEWLDAARQEIYRLADTGVEDIALCWYGTPEAWASLPGRETADWRVQQSILAELAAECGARLIRFERGSYDAWRNNRPDDESMRAAWAATVW